MTEADTYSMITVLDAASIVIALSGNKRSQGMVWQWFQREFAKGNRVLHIQLYRLIQPVVRNFDDNTRLEELIKFYNINKHRFVRGRAATETAIEIVKRNIALKNHEKTVLEWFKTKYPKAESKNTGEIEISFDLQPVVEDHDDEILHHNDLF